jgi:RNA polymerase sigma-70 factor, ECF subfamily
MRSAYNAAMTDAEACVAAAIAWPELPAPDAAFAELLQDHGADPAERERLHVGDLFLAHHALRGEPAAVATLRTLLEALRAPLRRTGASEPLIDEVLADLPADLVVRRAAAEPRLAGYTGRGPLAGWLRVIAVRTLVDRRRRTGASVDDDLVAELATPELDPELAAFRRHYSGELKAAFITAIAELAPLDLLLLRQRYLDGLGIDRLAALHGIHRATAARRLAAARNDLSAAVRRLLLDKLRVGGATLDSIIRLVGSELELSLDRYL